MTRISQTKSWFFQMTKRKKKNKKTHRKLLTSLIKKKEETKLLGLKSKLDYGFYKFLNLNLYVKNFLKLYETKISRWGKKSTIDLPGIKPKRPWTKKFGLQGYKMNWIPVLPTRQIPPMEERKSPGARIVVILIKLILSSYNTNSAVSGKSRKYKGQ